MTKLSAAYVLFFLASTAMAEISQMFYWDNNDCSGGAPERAIIMNNANSCGSYSCLNYAAGVSARTTCGAKNLSPLDGVYLRLSTDPNYEYYYKANKCQGSGSSYTMYQCASTNVTVKYCNDNQCSQGCSSIVIQHNATTSCETLVGAGHSTAAPVAFVFAIVSLVSMLIL